MTSICKKKISTKVQLIHAEQMLLKNFIILSKKNSHSWRLNNSNKVFLNQWESIDFHELIFNFYKSCNWSVKSILGRALKTKFLTQSLEWELQEYLFKINSKDQMAQFSEKTKKGLILVLCAQMQIFP